MDPLPISDALETDIRAKFLADAPISLPAERVRVSNDVGELPAPRLEILAGEARWERKMDGTAIVPVSLIWVSSLDDSGAPGEHRATAGALEAWWLGLRALRRPAPLPGAFSRVYVHDILYRGPVTSQDSEDREARTEIRAEWVATLYDPATL